MQILNSPTNPPSPAPERANVDDRRLRRLGLIIVLVVFGGFGTWAILAPLSSAAHAPDFISV